METDPLRTPSALSAGDAVFSPDCVALDLRARDKDGVLRELVGLLAAAGKVGDPGKVLAAVREREEMVSTGLAHGVALPHVRIGGLARPVAAAGIRRDGVEYGSIDGLPTRLIILLVSPENSGGPHLQFLARLAMRLKTPEGVDLALRAATPAELIAALDPGRAGPGGPDRGQGV